MSETKSEPHIKTERAKALLEKIGGSDGPSSKLNAEILAALLAPEGAFVEQSRINGAWCIHTPSTERSPQRLWEIPRPFRSLHADVTLSVDAALALVDTVLPGAHVRLDTGASFEERPIHVASVWAEEGNRGAANVRTTAAMAVCLALVSALACPG